MRYTVRRAGRVRDLAVPLYRWDTRVLGGTTLTGLVEVVPLLALTVLVYLKRPRSRAALLLFAYGTAKGMGLLNWFDGLSPGLETPFASTPLYWVARAFTEDIPPDLQALTLYLALTFPVLSPPARVHPRATVAVMVLVPLSWYPLYILRMDALELVEGLWFIVTLLAPFAVVLHNALTVRDPVVRAQVRWVDFAYAYSSSAFMVTFLGFFGVVPRSWNGWPPVSDLVLTVALAVAILRYRLLSIDVILNRALVYGALTAFVIGAYVAIVGYLSTLFPTRSGLVPPLIATDVVAVLFQPLRERVQRRVNRLLYGERDDPYAVLARLGQRLEGSLASDELLPTIAETVARTLKLPGVAILLNQDGALTLAAEYRAAYGPPPAAGERAAPASVALPLMARGEAVGELRLLLRPGERELGPADRRLLDDLSRQEGIAVQAARLTTDLRGLTVTLQQSRERLVTTREEERRRLRRDLHDGLGPTLASVTFKVEAARNLLRRDPAKADALLASVAEQTQGTIADIRRLVYDLSPPALDQLGLVAALRQYAAHIDTGTLVSVDVPDDLGPLPAAVEVAAYRIALEATTNALRHAAARHCVVHLAVDDAALCVEVCDDGRGLPERPRMGVGLHSMRERAAELGGVCAVEPRAGGGTVVRARLPLAVGAPAST